MDSASLRRVAVPLVLMLAMAGVLLASYGYDSQARALPVIVAWTTLGLLALEALVQAGTRAGRRIETFLAGGGGAPAPEHVPLAKVMIHAIGWPVFAVVSSLLIGILPGVLAYVFLSLKIAGGKSLSKASITASTVTVLAWLLFEWGMSYELYRGMLFEYFAGS